MDDHGFPLRHPVGDCMGWLAHNRQACPCYAEDRRQAKQAKRSVWSRLFGSAA